MSKDQLNRHDKSRTFVMARTVLVGLAREYTTLSYPQIARLMNRDHSTIFTSDNRAKGIIKTANRYRAVEKKLELKP